jgi:hypothetical protein
VIHPFDPLRSTYISNFDFCILQKRRADAEKNRSPDVLRAAVICVLGHVDTGMFDEILFSEYVVVFIYKLLLKIPSQTISSN